jgi:ribosome biogenesis GTPase
VLNKCDLETSVELLASLNSTYGGSLPLFALSAANHNGLGTLQEYLGQGHRGAFIGSTGVGKSSLLNALCPDIDLRVGEISDYKGLGRHTTSVSTLHALSGGGELVDTPGFRDFGLVELTAQDLAAYFPGFEELGEVACRFRNCRHRSEPGCCVVELAQAGRIPAERYQTYLEILDEVEADELLQKSKDWRN